MSRDPDRPGIGPALAGGLIFGIATWRAEKRRHAERKPESGARYTASEAEARRMDGGEDHGRDATIPLTIPWRGWKDILLRVWKEASEDHIALIAAGVAFYGLLSLFPAMGVVVALAGLFTQPSDFVGMLNDLAEFAPEEAAQVLITQAVDIAGSWQGGLGLTALVGLLLAIWSASRGMAGLIEGLNVVYDEFEKRSMLVLQLEVLALTLVVIAGTIVGLFAAVLVPASLAVFDPGGAAGAIAMLRWPILAVGTCLGLAILYRYGPSREHARWAWLSPGAIVACLLWLLGTVAFAWYAGSFAHYNETFGTLGGAIVLLMWLWLSAFAVLLGAELNAEIEAQTARDSTTGRELPMGARGAVKADTLGLPQS